MSQIDLFKQRLPDEIVLLQISWINAIKNRQRFERADMYEIIDDEILPLHTSQEYLQARAKEMNIFCELCWLFEEGVDVFSDLKDWFWLN